MSGGLHYIYIFVVIGSLTIKENLENSPKKDGVSANADYYLLQFLFQGTYSI